MFEEQQDYPAAVMVVSGVAFVVFGVTAVVIGAPGGLLLGALWVVLFVSFWSFSRLVTVVGEDTVEVRFRFGWPRRTIVLSSVMALEQVRNSWWHGWGVRKVAKGWMYNLWGLDAVALTLDSGAVFRIGTAHPDELEAALVRARTGR